MELVAFALYVALLLCLTIMAWRKVIVALRQCVGVRGRFPRGWRKPPATVTRLIVPTCRTALPGGRQDTGSGRLRLRMFRD